MGTVTQDKRTTDTKARWKSTTEWAKKRATATKEKISEIVREAQVEKVIRTTCSSCHTTQDVVIGGGVEGKIRATGAVVGATVLGLSGTVVGAGIGIASGGAAMAATWPLGLGGVAAGGLLGDRAGDWVAGQLRSNQCTNCGHPLDRPDKPPEDPEG